MNRKMIAGTTLTLLLIVTFFSAIPVVPMSAPAMPSVVGPKGETEWDVTTLWNFCRFVLEDKLRHLFGGDGVPDEQVRIAVVSENLTLWDEIHQYMTDPEIYPASNVLGQYANVTYSTRVDVNETDFSTVLLGVYYFGARLLIHLFSTQAGVYFVQQWRDMGVNATLVGINVEAQNMEYWEETEGKCEYETTLAESSVVQWQKSPRTGGARLEVVWPRDQVYSRRWRIPTWIYPLADSDLDYDGDVDMYDLIIVALPFGTKAGDPLWNLEADIDGNGIINIVDVSRVAMDFGESVSSLSMVGESMGTASSIPKITQTNSEAMVYLDLPTINATEEDVQTGRTFTVHINISDAVEIYGYQAGLTFNSTLLDCTFLNPSGRFLVENGEIYPMGGPGNIDNEAGVITLFGCTFKGEEYNASGSGQLAELEFKANAPGVSDLHLRDVMVMNSSNVYKMVPFNIIDTYTVVLSPGQTAVIVSNSTGQEATYGSGFYGHAFNPPANEISFNVTGPYPGFSNVTIPKTLIEVDDPDKLLVIINNTSLKTEERTVTENLTHYSVYFNYTLGIHNISILERPPVYNFDRDRYYATIQKAINSAESGHKILAYAGIHYENVVVNETVTLIGENKHNTVIDGSGSGTVIKVKVNNVNISGFTIRNSGNPEYGILVDGSSGNNISNNIITNNYIGICLHNSSGNTLTNNAMSGNKYNFGLYGAEGSHFDNTIDQSNTVDGKPVYYVKKASNTVYDSSTNAGTLYLIDCTNVTIGNLTLTKNVNGIFLWNTTNSKIQNVNASNNLNGIYLQGQSNHNNVTDNTISNNEVGIYLHSSNNSVIYHNSFIENTIQAKVTESYNTLWNNGYPSGGNYWSDHSIRPPFVVDEYKGVNQNVQGNDGIIDDSKVIDEENQDNYPLVSPLTPPVYNLNTHLGYTKIQDAINSAQSGHTIIVRAGTYSEQVTIGKSLTLIGIIGSTFISGTGTVVTVTANNVTFRGFTIQGSGSTDKGILLSYADNVVISENTITKKGYGIWLEHSNSCRISGNILKNNTEESLHLEYSGSAIVSRNTITNNTYGIYLIESSENDIHRNNLTDNTWGIYLWRSSNNTIYHNNFIDNTNQILLYQSSNTWDDGGLYLCPICGNPQPKGNYWSDYTGLDDGTSTQAHNCAGDGVGDTDTPHLGVDKYPLMSPRAPQNDVAVVSVTPYKTVVAQNYTASITVTFENHGDYTEKFNVTAYHNNTAIILPNGKNYTTITLTSESSTTITFTWNTTGFAKGNYTISANATIVLGEKYTADNTYTDGTIIVAMPGDINKPFGKINIKDIGIVAIAFGSKPGDSNWNPNADQYEDGQITIKDIGITAIHFGEEDC